MIGTRTLWVTGCTIDRFARRTGRRPRASPSPRVFPRLSSLDRVERQIIVEDVYEHRMPSRMRDVAAIETKNVARRSIAAEDVFSPHRRANAIRQRIELSGRHAPTDLARASPSRSTGPGQTRRGEGELEAVGLFDGQKRSIVHPVTHKVRVPIIDKRKAQVLSTHGNLAQLMDLGRTRRSNSRARGVPGQLASGQEIMYVEALGRRKLSSN